MSDNLFQEGGPHHVRRIGADRYEMRVSIPPDEQGLVARECPNEDCSPAYFKIKPGTGVTEKAEGAYCPYCRYKGAPMDFATKEQLRYAKDVLAGEAQRAVGGLLKKALGLGPSGRKKYGAGLMSVEVSVKGGQSGYVRPPLEEELRRDVTCPQCGLVHSVFGIAIWCPDCGRDLFLTHIETEYGIVKTMLADVDRRREGLGARVAARDIENALEDTVSIFEATLRAVTLRYLKAQGATSEAIDEIARKKIGNGFQSIGRAGDIALDLMHVELYKGRGSEEIDRLKATFEKRHPITHNLGVVDRKYLERVATAEQEGRDIRVTVGEVNDAIGECMGIISGLYRALFSGEGGSLSPQ